MEGNELYNNLNDNYDNSIESDNNILKNFLNDSILENIQIYNNKNWIYVLKIGEYISFPRNGSHSPGISITLVKG